MYTKFHHLSSSHISFVTLIPLFLPDSLLYSKSFDFLLSQIKQRNQVETRNYLNHKGKCSWKEVYKCLRTPTSLRWRGELSKKPSYCLLIHKLQPCLQKVFPLLVDVWHPNWRVPKTPTWIQLLKGNVIVRNARTRKISILIIIT